jgi:hypothetical protein
MWQLSLEGPLFKVIGGCGKRFGKGMLASRPRTPKSFKVKVLGTIPPGGQEEQEGHALEIVWTPHLPATPFHEEHYVFCIQELHDNGDEPSPWRELPLNKDQYQKYNEKTTEIGKPTKLKWKLQGLPAKASYKVKLCAAGPGGRSEWTSEARVATLAEPDENQGYSGPLHPNAPTVASEYKWWQSKHEVGLWISLPEDWTAKSLKVKVTNKRVDIKHVDGGTLLAGPLGGVARQDETDWIIEKDSEKGKQLVLTLRKEKLMQKWACFIDSDEHYKIDVELLKLFHEGNSMNELGCADLWD